MRCLRFRFRIRRAFLLVCACTLLLTLWLGSFSHQPQFTAQANDAQSNDAQSLLQIGVEQYESGHFADAVEPWLSAYAVYETTQDLPALAIVSENLARAYQQMGQTSTEIEYWQRAIAAIQSQNNPEKLGRLLTEQAQAYNRLGQQRRAIAILCGQSTLRTQVPTTTVSMTATTDCQTGSALQLSQSTADQMGQITALGSLGEAYRLSGDREQAMALFEQALDISRSSGEVELEGALLNSLGNTSTGLAQVSYRRANEAEASGDREAATFRREADSINAEAIEYFESSYALAKQQQSAAEQMRVLLSLIPAYERADQQNTAQQYWQLAATILEQLPASQMKAFAAIKLSDYLEPLSVRSLQTVLNATPPSPETGSQSTNLLTEAVDIGKTIENPRVVLNE